MAEKRRFLDVWIVESNTVYREVPYTVVVDWIQQGRLLEDDMLRWSGQAQWFRLGSTPAFAAYMPRAEPHRAEDQAEALESVHGDFAWKPRHDDEDDDVDMIPLIDVSLVLLIFFIMTGSTVVLASNIKTPEAENGDLISSRPELIWVGVDKGPDGKPIYSLGVADKPPAGPEDKNIPSLNGLLARLDQQIVANRGKVEVNIRANENLASRHVMDLVVELGKRKMIDKVYTGVSEKELP
jgi:biopolymer transport protein ExbD